MRFWRFQFEVWPCLQMSLNAELQALPGARRGLRKRRPLDRKSNSAFHKHLFSAEKGFSESHSQELLTPGGCPHLAHSQIAPHVCRAPYVRDLGHRTCRLSISHQLRGEYRQLMAMFPPWLTLSKPNRLWFTPAPCSSHLC